MNTPQNSAGNGILPFAIALSVITFLLVGWLWLRDSKSSRSGADEQVTASREETSKPTEPAPSASASNPPAKEDNQHPAKADTDRRKTKLENLDTRAAAAAAPDASKAAALAALKAKLPSVEVQFDPITSAPSYIMAAGKFLAPAADQAGDVYAPVRQFVNENAALFGHDATVLSDSRVTREDVTAHNGMRTVVWQQQVDGVPVYNTILKANLTKDGALVTMGSHFMSDAIAAIQMNAAQRTALIAQPPVDVKKALSLAAANLGDVVAPEQAQETSQPEGAERKQRFAVPKLSDTLAQLSWLPVGRDSAKLTWDVTLTSLKQNEMFRVLVDAKTGEVLMRTSLTNDISNASYRAYADATTKKPFDSPAPMLPGTPTPSGAQGVEVPRPLITLQAENLTASPNGWINDGVTETLGNNVDAHTDTDANNSPDLPRPTSATRVFDFAMDLTQAPSTYKDASVTQLFYLNNWMHDHLYALGFTESAGNFQTNNFGRGGLGNDAVQADAQDGSGTNNANMSTPADGSAPRMQMYNFTGPTPDRDGDFDAVIVLHEYTHGLSNRLVGGGVGMSALASRGMGEGWSDFYGLGLLSDPASDPNAVYPGGSYATLNFVAGMTSNYYYGIRRYPYSTDMTKNPLTFRDIDPSQASPHIGIPLSPLFGSSNSNPSEVHNVGEVWCMTLWECRANLIAKHGPAGAQLILQFVTDGMKLSPANPNLLQARDAIIQADLVSTGGVNSKELWAGFAKRGMGNSATSPASSTTTGVVEAFDVPDPLAVNPPTTVAFTAPVGGPFTPVTQTYGLTNNGTSPLYWTAAPSQPWLAVSPAGGTLAAGASTTVTMTFTSAAYSLAAGTYTATVNFLDTTTSVPLPRAVTLTVGGTNTTPTLALTIPATVTEGAPIQTGTVSIGTAQALPLTVTLASSNGAEASVPATVIIPATALSANFNITIGDDAVLDGTQNAIISATAAGFASAARVISVQDNETATLTLTAPPSATESSGTILGTLTVSAAPASPVTVSLSSSDPSAATVPAGVVIPPGQTSITVPITIVNDTMINGTHSTTISAQVANWTGSSAIISIADNETTTLALSMPASINEGSTATGTVSITGTLPAPLVVSLASNTTSRLTVPATATIATGTTTATFTLSTVNNALTDGTATVTITANTAGFTGATRTTNVLDNDVHHFTFNSIASPQTRGAPFSATITAKDVNDVTIANYTTSVPLTATGSGGAVSVTPATTGAFTAGVRTLNVTVNTFSTGVTLTVNDGAGHLGTSNAFDVTVGPLNRFAWNTIASPQAAGTPFSPTITALDAGNNTVTSFGGSAGIRPIPPSFSIGTGTAATTVLPLYTFYHDQRSQCIYLQSQVGAAATITGLALNVTTVPGQTMNNWTIRMKHTALASYTTAAWEGTGWTTVYQANQTISSTGLVTFNFTTPFAYDGVSNLMVDFSFNNSSFTTAGGVTYTTASPARTIHYFTDSGYGDPLIWTGTSSPTPISSTILPNIKLVTAGGGSVAPGLTGSFTGGVWTGNVVALQGSPQMALQADDGAGHTGDSNAFAVNGFAGAEISVEQPALTVLTDGAATVDFGVAGVGSDPATKTFVIRNVGGLPLTISGMTGDGPDIASFAAPTLAGVVIQPGQSFSFTVQFTAASAGPKTAAIHIASNDADENPFDVALTGTGAVAPEMKLEQPSGTERADGSGTIAFGDSVLGVLVVKTLTIRNTGGAVLNLGAVTVDGANGGDFIAGAASSATIAAGTSATLNVTFTPGSTGARSAALHIVSNDPNENPYDIMLTGIGSAPAGLLRIARDINQTGAGPGITATNSAIIGGTIYFAANTGDTGTELWKTDGTAAGTMLVKDIFAGTSSSTPANFVVIGTTLFFTATNGTTGVELWKSDGTTAGTVLVKDIFSGASSSTPTNLTNVAGTLYFAATDSTANGIELWKSDGTTAGTVLVLNINATANTSSSPANLTAVGSTLFFTANDGINGVELWKSDGSAVGTVLVSDIFPGPTNSSPASLVAVGTTLFFSANDGVNGIELWSSDGTTTGIVMDINPGSANSSPAALVNAAGTLFFRATTAANGSELWKSDGTAAGTVLVLDINPGTGGSTPSSLFVFGSQVYFSAFTSASGTELWKSDGTAGGTVLVRDINPGTASSTPTNFTLVGSTLYFSATSAGGGAELWRTDGTAAGTVQVEDINPGTGGSGPSVMFNVGGVLFFLANDGANGSELWTSDGTAAGTNLIRDITPGSGNAAPLNLRVLNGAVLFNATDGVNGAELWRSDGLPGGTTLLKDIFAGASSSSPGAGVVIGSTLYFPAGDSAGGTELWKTDGTNANTVRVKDIFTGATGSFPANLTRVGSTLFFAASDLTANGSELWKSDGMDPGTVLVANINPLANTGSAPANLTDFNGALVFTANDGTNGIELWKSDGTTPGTVLVKDINPGSVNSSPANFRAIGSTLYFTATTAAEGNELWKTDGTTAGTALVADIATGTASSSPASLTVVGSTLYFSAFNSANGRELWKTDGTAAGTVLVADIASGVSSSSPANITAVGSTLYFSAFTSANGTELWKSDGTAAGTVLVADINAGTLSSSPANLANAYGTLYFSATTAANGTELWKSDGTAAGTMLAADIRPGVLSSSPANLTVLDNRLLLTATGPDLGSEVWVYDLLAEIAVEQPLSSGLVDGVGSRSFGSLLLGNNASLTFTVKNIGGSNLTGLSISKDGADNADFSVGSLGATTLTPGTSTTFTVTFAPGALGVRNAAIHIASNDADENPFDTLLTGTGLTQLESWRLTNFGSAANTGDGADANDYEFDGMVNFLEFCLGTHPKQATPIPQSLVKVGGTLEFTYQRAKAAVLDGVVFAVKWNDSLTPGVWSSAGVTELILSDNGTVQQVKATLPAGAAGQRFVRLEATGM